MQSLSARTSWQFLQSIFDSITRAPPPPSSDFTDAVQMLKEQPGKDIIVYGGATFASSLITQGLIDEYYIFRRQVAIGKGLSIFAQQTVFELESSITYKNGTLLNWYLPVQVK